MNYFARNWIAEREWRMTTITTIKIHPDTKKRIDLLLLLLLIPRFPKTSENDAKKPATRLVERNNEREPKRFEREPKIFEREKKIFERNDATGKRKCEANGRT